MDEKVKATWDDPQGAPVKKSAEAPQPPSRRMTARAPEIRQTRAPSFGRSARACRISIVSVSGPPRHRFFQGRGSLDPRGSTVFKPERSTSHCCLERYFRGKSIRCDCRTDAGRRAVLRRLAPSSSNEERRRRDAGDNWSFWRVLRVSDTKPSRLLSRRAPQGEPRHLSN